MSAMPSEQDKAKETVKPPRQPREDEGLETEPAHTERDPLPVLPTKP